jgi:hypothetical protein
MMLNDDGIVDNDGGWGDAKREVEETSAHLMSKTTFKNTKHERTRIEWKIMSMSLCSIKKVRIMM